MALSPGVEIIEIDASTIVPTVSNNIAVFAGDFDKGPIGTYVLISKVDDLISYFGYPTNINYNSWYQVYNFLQYGNYCLVSRASNTNGTATDSGLVVSANIATGETIVTTADTTGLVEGQYVVFGDAEGAIIDSVYQIINVTTDTSIELDRALENDIVIATNDTIYTWTQSMNAVFEAVDSGAVGEATTADFEYVVANRVITNDDEFEQLKSTIPFVNTTDTKLKFISRNPGNWGNDIEIAIGTPAVFNTTTPSEAFAGILIDNLFSYAPTSTEIAVIIKVGADIVESYIVDLDPTAKDYNNKSTYIENVINSTSNYVYVVDNVANTDTVKPYVYKNNGVSGTTAKLVNGVDSTPGNDDLLDAYSLFSNKESLDVDIVIANELDGGASAKALVDERQDCMAFIGAPYSDTVGQKAATATANLIDWRQNDINYNNMFVVACGSYKFMYDRYNDVNRWCNIAGDIAGLRALTSQNYAFWYASAGLDRGQLRGVLKLSFNPTQAMRDQLYKNENIRSVA